VLIGLGIGIDLGIDTDIGTPGEGIDTLPVFDLDFEQRLRCCAHRT
jgi:hypothetical protein